MTENITRTEIKCIDRYGVENTFTYHIVEHGPNEWQFIIEMIPPNNVDFADIQFKRISGDTARTTWMGNDFKPYYSGKGIFDAMIPEAAKVLGIKIVSSRKKVEPGEWREPEAEAVWLRLIDKGLVRYDADRDEYSLI